MTAHKSSVQSARFQAESQDFPTPEQIASWLALFVSPEQVTELRAIGVSTRAYRRPHTVAGFFDGEHLLDMAESALLLTPDAEGVYFVPNPLEPALLARRCNRVGEAREDQLAKDCHIIERRWLLVDCDPVRPVSGVSATAAEKGHAHTVAVAVRQWLRGSLASPIVADSGNGYHLLYPAAGLPASDEGIVRAWLHAIASRFSSPLVEIDTSVFNPARIVKLYGTLARKGDDTAMRPHRASRLLVTPQWLRMETAHDDRA